MEQSSLLLRKQLKGIRDGRCIARLPTVPVVELTKNPVEGFSAGLVDESNIYEVLLVHVFLTHASVQVSWCP